MPLYQYQDQRTGEVTELWRPMALRDCVPKHLKRLMVCPALRPDGLAEKPEIDVVKSALRGFKEIESQPGGTAEIRRVMQMSPDQIKDVWTQPQAPAPLPA